MRHGPQAERDLPAEEADHDHDALPVDELRGARERLLRPDEVEHRVERPLEVARIGGRLGTELERALLLRPRGIARDDGGVREQPDVLDPVLPEPARSQDNRPRARLQPRAAHASRRGRQ